MKGLFGQSWAALGAYVDGLGGSRGLYGRSWTLLEPMRPVLAGSRGLCDWSWVALRASVGGPEHRLGPLWPVLGGSQGLVGGPGPKSGPGLGENAILESGSGQKSGPSPSGKAALGPVPERLELSERCEAQYQFFQKMVFPCLFRSVFPPCPMLNSCSFRGLAIFRCDCLSISTYT